MRNENNYPLLTEKFRDWRGDYYDVIVMPTLFKFTESKFTLEFEGWESLSAWRENRSFEIGFQTHFNQEIVNVREQSKDVFSKLDLQIYQFLGINETDYEIKEFSINLNNLTVFVRAEKRNQASGNQTVIFQSVTAEQFENVKLENVELVATLINFAIFYGKSNSEYLAKLQFFNQK